MDAPHAAKGDVQADVAAFFDPPYFEWWNAEGTTKEGQKVTTYSGWEASLEAIKKHMTTLGPFSGVLGFSQVCQFQSRWSCGMLAITHFPPVGECTQPTCP
jgi:Serine hydrolase (FSH1)